MSLPHNNRLIISLALARRRRACLSVTCLSARCILAQCVISLWSPSEAKPRSESEFSPKVRRTRSEKPNQEAKSKARARE